MQRAGALDKVMAIVAVGTTQDPRTGEPAEGGGAVVHANVPCNYRDLRGAEAVQALGQVASQVRVFRCRWADGISPGGHLVRCEGTDWDIKAVAELGMRETMELTCTLHRGAQTGDGAHAWSPP